MKPKDELTLTQSAIELQKLNQLVVKAVMDRNLNKLGSLLDQYSALKKEIKTKLIGLHSLKVQDTKARKILQKISSQEPLSTDKIIEHLAKQSGETLELDELEEEEINSLGSDLLYSWFSHYEYIRNLYSISSLILGIPIPDRLKELIAEARLCYAFERYSAVYSLCRTILEVTIKDICIRGKLLQPDKKGNVNFDSYTTRQLRDAVSNGSLNDKIRDLYKDTSLFIHGNNTVLSIKGIDAFKQTLTIVQELYANHENILG